MGIFILKLVLTPVLIAAVTLVARRWGPIIGGWMLGLPLTSGPVSVFLLAEQGPGFAAAAACSSILATLSMVAFSLAYARAAGKFPWPRAVCLALAANISVMFLITRITPDPVAATVIVALIVAVILSREGTTVAEVVILPAPWWDIPFRMVTATSIVMGVTVVSPYLGPTLSGTISTLPVFIAVMSVFAHKMSGPANAIQLERGVITGAFSFAAFFLVVALTVEKWHPVPVYAFACLVTGLVNLAVLLIGNRIKARA